MNITYAVPRTRIPDEVREKVESFLPPVCTVLMVMHPSDHDEYFVVARQPVLSAAGGKEFHRWYAVFCWKMGGKWAVSVDVNAAQDVSDIFTRMEMRFGGLR
jgi:hypothetical protein